jgi:hypothetical protein
VRCQPDVDGEIFQVRSYAGVIRPLPRHCLQAGGKILRPGLAGWATVGNPVPSQAGHLTSVDAAFGFKFFIASFPGNDGHGIHIILQDGLLAPAVPFDRNPGPGFFGDGALIVLVATPANAGADVQQSGLGAGHSFCRFSAVLRAAPP